MDRVLISWSIPNLITINLMAWLGLLAMIALYQLAIRGKGSSGTDQGGGGGDDANNAGGY